MMLEQAIRLAWTFVSAAGAVYALANWRDAAGDFRAVRHLPDYRPDGPRAVVGRANIRREQLRLVTQGCFLAAGVLTILAPPPPSPHQTRSWITGAFVVAQLAAVVNDLLDRNDRRKTIEAPGHTYRRRKSDG